MANPETDMYWVLQSEFFDPSAFDRLVEILHAQGIQHAVVAVVAVDARALALVPDVQPQGNVFVCGSSALGRVARTRGWWPGYIDDNLDYALLARRYGEHMLNAGATIVRLRDARPLGETTFVRPVDDLKGFGGRVMPRIEFADWQAATLAAIAAGRQTRLTIDSEIVLAQPRTIQAEYRLRFVAGELVGASTYRRGGAPFFSDIVDDRVLAFGRARIAEWSPNVGFALDVADTPEGLKVVEINAINASAFYATDIARFVDAIGRLGENPLSPEEPACPDSPDHSRSYSSSPAPAAAGRPT